jgi:hypothetical protein
MRRQQVEVGPASGLRSPSPGDRLYGVRVPLKHPINGDRLVFNSVIHAYQDKAGTLENEIGPRLRALVMQLDALAANAQL